MISTPAPHDPGSDERVGVATGVCVRNGVHVRVEEIVAVRERDAVTVSVADGVVFIV